MNSRNRAFTLIELLVVIAIIAILAAILFPVFAQAKKSAKAAASISNVKQIQLSMLMYCADYDDIFVPQNRWDNGGNFVGYSSWVWQILPYQKNADIMGDPLAPAIPRNTPFGFINQATLTTTYGYNYTCLSPFLGATPTAGPSPRSQTALGEVANTIMITSKFEPITESTLGYNGYWSYGAGGPDTTAIVDPPDCSNSPSWCFDNWGVGSFWYSPSFVGIKTDEAGRLSAGVSSRSADKAIIGWADGHVNKQSLGAVAAGTNWTKTRTSGTIAVTDVTKYVWDDK